MNYCDKIHYSLLTASPEDFPSMIDSLLSRLPEEERILRLVLFGTPVLKDEYVTQRQLFKAESTPSLETANRLLVMFCNPYRMLL